MRLRRVQFTVRRLMVVVAVSAVFLAARVQVARWEDKRRRYEILSEVYSDNPFQKWADLTHDQWLARCREIDERNRKGHLMLGLTLVYPPRPDVARRAAERFERFRKQCEWACATPGGPTSLGHLRSERLGWFIRCTATSLPASRAAFRRRS